MNNLGELPDSFDDEPKKQEQYIDERFEEELRGRLDILSLEKSKYGRTKFDRLYKLDIINTLAEPVLNSISDNSLEFLRSTMTATASNFPSGDSYKEITEQQYLVLLTIGYESAHPLIQTGVVLLRKHGYMDPAKYVAGQKKKIDELKNVLELQCEESKLSLQQQEVMNSKDPLEIARITYSSHSGTSGIFENNLEDKISILEDLVKGTEALSQQYSQLADFYRALPKLMADKRKRESYCLNVKKTTNQLQYCEEIIRKY